MKGNAPSTRRRLFLALIGLVALTVAGLVWIDQELHPSRAEVGRIKAGMTREEVTKLLGALYDETRPGENAEVDQILRERDRGAEAVSVMSYRISGSRDTVWILCGADETVIETWIPE